MSFSPMMTYFRYIALLAYTTQSAASVNSRRIVLSPSVSPPPELDDLSSSTSVRDTYDLMMECSTFDSSLHRIKEYACLKSRSEAVDLLWRFNEDGIRNLIPPKSSPIAIPPDTPQKSLKAICRAYLSLREELLSWIVNGELVLSEDRSAKAFKAVGLLASSNGLRILNWDGSILQDLTVLSGLVKLDTLRLFNVSDGDLRPLASLRTLRVLYLYRMPTCDIRPLSELVHLEFLYLIGSQVGDLSPLGRLSKLKVLDLSGSLEIDVRPLANLRALRILYLSGCRVRSFASLSGLLAPVDVFSLQDRLHPNPSRSGLVIFW